MYLRERLVTGALVFLLLAGCVEQPALSPLRSDAVILAFGDSLTYGTGVGADNSYPAVLAKLTGRKVIRSGIPGEISAKGRERLASVLKDVKPDLVLICHGGNDVLRRLPPSKTEENLRAMINAVRASGAEVMLIAVPRFGLFPEPFEFYHRIQEDLAVPVEFDILSDLLADNAMKSDQVHFNVAGYRKMAEAAHQLMAEAGAL